MASGRGDASLVATLDSLRGWAVQSTPGRDSMSELADLQKLISETRAKRGFVTDPVKLQVLLSEEVGEIASEIKRLWSVNYDDFDRDRLKEEIADVFVLLTALANEFHIDIERAVVDKFLQKDGSRSWKSATE